MSCNIDSRRGSFASRRQSSARSASQGQGKSQIAEQVINAKQPIQTNAREQVQAGQFQGLYLNKSEVDAFRGDIPIEQYQINEDPNPEVIKKRLDKLRYTQEVATRWLNPPPAPKPGNLIVRERQQTHGPAPPLVIRQEGDGAQTPAPLIYRQEPPKRPACIPEQVVEVDACPIPPPPRRVVVEKLSNLPAKPQNILIEKWLPYKPQKRRVIYEKACGRQQDNPRNLVIEWEAPEVEVEKVCKDLGVVDADPEEYRRRYGSELKKACEIPDLCCSQPPHVPSPAPSCPPTPRCAPARQQTPRRPTPRQATPAASACGNGARTRVSPRRCPSSSATCRSSPRSTWRPTASEATVTSSTE